MGPVNNNNNTTGDRPHSSLSKTAVPYEPPAASSGSIKDSHLTPAQLAMEQMQQQYRDSHRATPPAGTLSYASRASQPPTPAPSAFHKALAKTAGYSIKTPQPKAINRAATAVSTEGGGKFHGQAQDSSPEQSAALTLVTLGSTTKRSILQEQNPLSQRLYLDFPPMIPVMVPVKMRSNC